MILIIAFLLFIISIFVIVDIAFRTESEWEKWLKKKLKDDPSYINWLKIANGGKGYKLGLKILKKINKRGEKR